jgi:hypothetical protein
MWRRHSCLRGDRRNWERDKFHAGREFGVSALQTRIRPVRSAQIIYKFSTVVRFTASTLVSGRESGLERKGEKSMNTVPDAAYEITLGITAPRKHVV